MIIPIYMLTFGLLHTAGFLTYIAPTHYNCVRYAVASAPGCWSEALPNCYPDHIAYMWTVPNSNRVDPELHQIDQKSGFHNQDVGDDAPDDASAQHWLSQSPKT